MRESNNKRNHADTQAMVISSAAGELTLGIGLGFVSVGLGILGLIIKSDCEELSCCYGLIWCKKKRRRTRRGSGDSGSSDSSGDPPAAASPEIFPGPRSLVETVGKIQRQRSSDFAGAQLLAEAEER